MKYNISTYNKALNTEHLKRNLNSNMLTVGRVFGSHVENFALTHRKIKSSQDLVCLVSDEIRFDLACISQLPSNYVLLPSFALSENLFTYVYYV